MLLPEDLIIRILLHIEHPHRNAASYRIVGLRRVCSMFWRICDSPEVLRRMPLRDIRQCLRRRDVR